MKSNWSAFCNKYPCRWFILNTRLSPTINYSYGLTAVGAQTWINLFLKLKSTRHTGADGT